MNNYAEILQDRRLLTDFNTNVDFTYSNYLGKCVEGEIKNFTGVVLFNPWELSDSYVNVILPMTGLKFQRIDDDGLFKELLGDKRNMLDSIELNFGNFIDLGERYVAKGKIEVGGEEKEVLLFVYYKMYEATRVLTAELKFSKPIYSDQKKGLLFENTFSMNVIVNLDA